MKAMVVGGAGYIGTAVSNSFVQGEAVVVDIMLNGPVAPKHLPCLRTDVRDSRGLGKIMMRENIDIVIHLAALSDARGSMRESTNEHYSTNVEGTISLLTAMVKSRVRRLVFASSAAVYGSRMLPVAESAAANPSSPYGRTKAMCEQIIGDHVRANLLDAAILRYFNVAGDRDPSPTRLLPRIRRVVDKRTPRLPIYGSPVMARDYIHVRDAAAVTVAVAKLWPSIKGEAMVFNVGRGVALTVKDIIDLAQQLSGCEVPIEQKPPANADVDTCVADMGKAKALLNFEPCYSIEEIVSSALVDPKVEAIAAHE